MRRLSSDDSLNGLMSICPNSTVDADEHNHGNNPMYTRDFQTTLEGMDEEGCVEESGHISEKKRRLNAKQVKALEKYFEVENKLEPERKVKLAQELGLEPRQVAVWFQNRRARWKTKQLERDYGLLKANYDALKNRYESLQRENEDLLNEIQEVKLKISHVKEEKCDLDIHDGEAAAEMNLGNSDVKENEMFGGGVTLGDGSSDSDSSAILNGDNNSPTTAAISSSGGIFRPSPQQFLVLDVHCGWLTDPAMNTNFAAKASVLAEANKVCQSPTQLVKIEEHNFLGEESCSNLFSDDQAPTLHWYCNDEWNCN